MPAALWLGAMGSLCDAWRVTPFFGGAPSEGSEGPASAQAWQVWQALPAAASALEGPSRAGLRGSHKRPHAALMTEQLRPLRRGSRARAPRGASCRQAVEQGPGGPHCVAGWERARRQGRAWRGSEPT